MRILSLFDGISCGQLALQRANIVVDTYYASEIDINAIKVTKHHFPNTIELGSVVDINGYELKNIDMIIGGSPCQGFSLAGKMNGMSTTLNYDVLSLEHYLELKEQGIEFSGQSYLFWEYIRLLKEIKPKYFFLENVKMEEKWKIVLTNALATTKACNCCGIYESLELTSTPYHYQCKHTKKIEKFEPLFINSRLVSAQERKRYYWTNIEEVEQPLDRNIGVQDILETPGFVAAMRGRRIKDNTRFDYDTTIPLKQYLECRKDNKSNCVTTISKDNVVVPFKSERQEAKKGNYRLLTPLEQERLQTLPDNYTNVIPKSHRTKAIGNGWTVDVIAHIFSYLPKEYKNES